MTRERTHRKRRRARGISELSAIDLLSRHFRVRDESVLFGIGDDAAVLAPVRTPLVWTVDTSVEHVHFRRAWLSLEEIANRSYHAALSDLGAMGARPVAALSSLILPAGTTRAEIRALARGQARAATDLACPVIGGNIARGSELSITITALGFVKRPLMRTGARDGDELWLVGDIGLAGAGLEWLASGRERQGGGKAAKVCRDAWRRPRALVAEGQKLAISAHAAIDVSDGLAGDTGHIALASGVRIVIAEDKVRAVLRPELRRVAQRLGRDPLDLALYGGEDYALLATGPSRRRPESARAIGKVEPGSGVYLETEHGTRKRLAGGFDHLLRRV